MKRRTLADWLAWQESLNPAEIELGLERVQAVLARLEPKPAPAVLTVGGTNGKGSTVGFLDRVLRAGGLRTGVYTSPHLRRYNERIRIDGIPVTDAELTRAFRRVDAARGDTPLTYFEFGTLAAWQCFSDAQLDAWVLEVGLGGRLDAVNAIDPQVSLVTTVDFDHQDYLGDTLEEIAAEKAGIFRSGRPALYGDAPVPSAITDRAVQIDAPLSCWGRDFSARRWAGAWEWRGRAANLADLPMPEPGDDAQLRNASLALAALEQLDPALLDYESVVTGLTAPPPAGRFQRIGSRPEWLLDVAHNPQAARVLADRCRSLPAVSETIIVLGLLADKSVDGVVAALAALEPAGWICCTPDHLRGRESARLAARLRELGHDAQDAGLVSDALTRAAVISGPAARIIVCGSFSVVGPALDWLAVP
jgi:dihydrofolate synthase/folylpolyglutamate synthase